LTAEEVSPIEFHCQMQVVYGDDCVDVSTVCRWPKKCKAGEQGRPDLCVKQQSRRPLTATNEFHKKKVYELIKG
jgi:hypothetical protein